MDRYFGVFNAISLQILVATRALVIGSSPTAQNSSAISSLSNDTQHKITHIDKKCFNEIYSFNLTNGKIFRLNAIFL